MPLLSRLAFFVALILPVTANAEGFATGAEITAALAGNTVQEGIVGAGAFIEFYAADGTLKGVDYTATWTVSGDKMCFNYGEGPECWNVRIEGESVTWVRYGNEGGTGTIVKGNPNNY